MENIQEEIEDKVIDCINFGVSGRLVAIKPEKNIFGADLDVRIRGEYKKEGIYFQINSLIGPVKEDNFTKDFSQDSFKAGKNFYLLFVYFNEALQKIDDHIWIIPSLQFKDMAKVAKSKFNKKLLRFESPLDINQKNDYSRFIIDTKNLGKLVLKILEEGDKFVFKGGNLYEDKSVNLESLKEFLCEARKNTYASSNANPVDNPRLLASTQFEFQKGDYSYRDIYFTGGKKFIGQEIVYLKLTPIWGMNYIGDEIKEKETSFLKESLQELADKCRLGGSSCEHEKRDFKYKDSGRGSIDNFSGTEEIYVSNKVIYKLDYQGGLIV